MNAITEAKAKMQGAATSAAPPPPRPQGPAAYEEIVTEGHVLAARVRATQFPAAWLRLTSNLAIVGSGIYVGYLAGSATVPLAIAGGAYLLGRVRAVQALPIVSIPARVMAAALPRLGRLVTPSLAAERRRPRRKWAHLYQWQAALAAGDRRGAAEVLWPQRSMPGLYARGIPADLRRPLWADGHLPDDYALWWAADRVVQTKDLVEACRRAVAAPILALPLALPFALPGEMAAWLDTYAEMLPAAIESVAWSLLSKGDPSSPIEWALLAGLIVAAAARALGRPHLELGRIVRPRQVGYALEARDATAVAPRRVEQRRMVWQAWSAAVQHATGYAATDPVITIGRATGTLRRRGVLLAPEQGTQVSWSDVNTGLLVLGATGSGKTRSVLRPVARQLLAQGNIGAYVTDAKAVLWKPIAEIAAQLGRADDVRVIGPGRDQWGVDLLDGIEPGDAAALIGSVAAAAGAGKDSFWTDRASQIIEHVARIAQAYEVTPEGLAEADRDDIRPYSLWWIYRAATDPDMLDRAIVAVVRSFGDGAYEAYGHVIDTQELRWSVDYMLGPWRKLAPETKSGVTANIDRLLGGLSSSAPLRTRFGTGGGTRTLRLREALDGRILLCAVSNLEGGAAARLVLALLKAQLYRQLRLRQVHEGAEVCRARPVMLLADEVQELLTGGGAVTGLDDVSVLNVSREAGLIPVFATQSVSALRLAIGDAGTDNLVSCLRSLVVLRTEDRATLELVQAMAGQVVRAPAAEPGQAETLDERIANQAWHPFGDNLDAVSREARWPEARLLRIVAGVNVLPIRYHSATLGAPEAVMGFAVTEDQLRSQREDEREARDNLRRARTEGVLVEDAVHPSEVASGWGQQHAIALVQRAGLRVADVVELG